MPTLVRMTRNLIKIIQKGKKEYTLKYSAFIQIHQ